MSSGYIPAKDEPGPGEIVEALREAVFENPRLREMPAEEVARQLVSDGRLLIGTLAHDGGGDAECPGGGRRKHGRRRALRGGQPDVSALGSECMRQVVARLPPKKACDPLGRRLEHWRDPKGRGNSAGRIL